MNQTWENYEKLKFGPDFGPFGPDLPTPFDRGWATHESPGIKPVWNSKIILYKIIEQRVNAIFQNIGG